MQISSEGLCRYSKQELEGTKKKGGVHFESILCEFLIEQD
jgi:hypothetical protein